MNKKPPPPTMPNDMDLFRQTMQGQGVRKGVSGGGARAGRESAAANAAIENMTGETTAGETMAGLLDDESGGADAPADAIGQKKPPIQLKKSLPQLDELQLGKNQGVDSSNFEKFRRGHMAIDATLDLHGLTQDRAHTALKNFIARESASGSRCVLIITGKGGARRADSDFEKTGVLRENLPRWLNGAAIRPAILSFSSAQPRHGGSGAFYVLLKRGGK